MLKVSAIPGAKQPAGVSKFEKAMVAGTILDMSTGFVNHEWGLWWACVQCATNISGGGGGTFLSVMAHLVWGIQKTPQSQAPLVALAVVEKWYKDFNSHLF
jgi:hypothetical protein